MTTVGENQGDIAAFAELAKAVGIHLCSEDVMDILWLANQTGPIPSPSQRELADEDEADTVTVVQGEDLPTTASDQIPLTPQQGDTQDDNRSRRPQGGIPIAVPAAPALRTRLALGRALRPLMRKVAALNRTYLDEEATANQIAEQDVWLPVLCPAAERWLELALVVEEAPSLPIWKSLIRELQLLMERQGAFRTVQPWRLTASETNQPQLFPGSCAPRPGQRSRSPKELIDPAGRRLILVVSDCTSPLWRQGKIHPWLGQWGQLAPLTLLQLFPQRLWERSALGQGSPVWMRSFSPGRPTSYWDVDSPLDFLSLEESAVPKQETLAIPVVTTESSSLEPWAKVMVGTGEAQATGVQFDTNQLMSVSSSDATQDAPDAQTLVRRFRGGASIQAQRLAGLMAAVPVSPDIVDLIRQTLLPEAQQVHMAEVFMGGLIRMTRTPNPSGKTLVAYDFVSEEVRDLLTDAVEVPKTEAVLEAVSKYISARLGLSTRSLEALLVPNTALDDAAQAEVLPFAYLARRTLRRMGDEYADLVDLLEQPSVLLGNSSPEQPISSGFPDFKTFEFEVARFISETEATWPPLQTKDFEVVKVNAAIRDRNEQLLIGRIAEMYSGRGVLPNEGLQAAELLIGEAARPLPSNPDLLEIFERPGINQRLIIVGEPGAGKTTLMMGLTARLIQRAEQDTHAPIPIPLNLASWQSPNQSLMDWLVGQLMDQYKVNKQLAQNWLRNRQLLPLLDGLDELPGQRIEPVIEAINQWLVAMDPPGLVVCSRLFEYERSRTALRLNAAIHLAPSLLGEFGFETATLKKQERRGFLGLGRRQAQWQIQIQRRQGRQQIEPLGDDFTLEMVRIPAGQFLMGSLDNEPNRYDNESPQHQVTVAWFLMGRTPITQAQWRFVARLPQQEINLNLDPARFKGANRPVESVTWHEAVEFCARLSVHTGRDYRLPSEAEWEYACRADTTTPFCFGDTLSTDLANYRGTATPYNGGPKGKYREETTEVGAFPANPWGLSDMHGNVWEWCQDVWHANYEEAPADGSPWVEGGDPKRRVLRGGSWSYFPRYCRSACRGSNNPGARFNDLGFRVVCSSPRTQG